MVPPVPVVFPPITIRILAPGPSLIAQKLLQNHRMQQMQRMEDLARHGNIRAAKVHREVQRDSSTITHGSRRQRVRRKGSG